MNTLGVLIAKLQNGNGSAFFMVCLNYSHSREAAFLSNMVSFTNMETF